MAFEVGFRQSKRLILQCHLLLLYRTYTDAVQRICALPKEENASDTEAISPEYAAGWTANYKVLSLEDNSIIADIGFGLPEDEVMHQLRCAAALETTKFSFPVSFASDLSQVALLASIFTPIGAPRKPCTEFRVQSLDPPFRHPEFTPDSYSTSFSRSGEYFLFVRRPIGEGRCFDWNANRHVLVVYQKDRAHGGTSFGFIERLDVLVPERDVQLPLHPSEPVLALMDGSKTMLWFFAPSQGVHAKKRPPIVVHQQSLSQLSFSDCGRFLHGYPGSLDAAPAIVNIQKYIERQPHGKAIQAHGRATRSLGSSLQLSRSGNRSLELSGTSTSVVQHSNTISIKDDMGRTTVSMLRQDLQTASITLQSLDGDGSARVECMTRLPKSETLKNSFSTLLPPTVDDPQTVKLLLNQKPQKWYDPAERPDFTLPALVERQRESIPVLTGKRALTSGDLQVMKQTKRPRLMNI